MSEKQTILFPSRKRRKVKNIHCEVLAANSNSDEDSKTSEKIPQGNCEVQDTVEARRRKQEEEVFSKKMKTVEHNFNPVQNLTRKSIAKYEAVQTHNSVSDDIHPVKCNLKCNVPKICTVDSHAKRLQFKLKSNNTTSTPKECRSSVKMLISEDLLKQYKLEKLEKQRLFEELQIYKVKLKHLEQSCYKNGATSISNSSMDPALLVDECNVAPCNENIIRSETSSENIRLSDVIGETSNKQHDNLNQLVQKFDYQVDKYCSDNQQSKTRFKKRKPYLSKFDCSKRPKYNLEKASAPRKKIGETIMLKQAFVPTEDKIPENSLISPCNEQISKPNLDPKKFHLKTSNPNSNTFYSPEVPFNSMKITPDNIPIYIGDLENNPDKKPLNAICITKNGFQNGLDHQNKHDRKCSVIDERLASKKTSGFKKIGSVFVNLGDSFTTGNDSIVFDRHHGAANINKILINRTSQHEKKSLPEQNPLDSVHKIMQKPVDVKHQIMQKPLDDEHKIMQKPLDMEHKIKQKPLYEDRRTRSVTDHEIESVVSNNLKPIIPNIKVVSVSLSKHLSKKTLDNSSERIKIEDKADKTSLLIHANHQVIKKSNRNEERGPSQQFGTSCNVVKKEEVIKKIYLPRPLDENNHPNSCWQLEEIPESATQALKITKAKNDPPGKLTVERKSSEKITISIMEEYKKIIEDPFNDCVKIMNESFVDDNNHSSNSRDDQLWTSDNNVEAEKRMSNAAEVKEILVKLPGEVVNSQSISSSNQFKKINFKDEQVNNANAVFHGISTRSREQVSAHRSDNSPQFLLSNLKPVSKTVNVECSLLRVEKDSCKNLIGNNLIRHSATTATTNMLNMDAPKTQMSIDSDVIDPMNQIPNYRSNIVPNNPNSKYPNKVAPKNATKYIPNIAPEAPCLELEKRPFTSGTDSPKAYSIAAKGVPRDDKPFSQLCSICGTLVALSHTFIMVSNNVFFAKFHLEDPEKNPLAQGTQDSKENLSTTQESVTVVVNVPQLQGWWEGLQIGQKYFLTRLGRSLLFKSSHRIPVLLALRCSTLTAKVNSAGSGVTTVPPNVLKQMQLQGWTSYQGTVTRVLNDSLGIYELDRGRARLLTAPLLGVTTQLQQWEPKKMSLFRVGDTLLIQFPHITTLAGWREGGQRSAPLLLLLCCARTTISNVSHPYLATPAAPKDHTGGKEASAFPSPPHLRVHSAALDAVHHFPLPGVHWLHWLAALEDTLLCVLMPLGVTEDTIKRNAVSAGGEPVSPLSRLMQSWHDRTRQLASCREGNSPSKSSKHLGQLQQHTRSYAKEFLLQGDDHCCLATAALDQKFITPFEVVTLDQLEMKQQQQQNDGSTLGGSAVSSPPCLREGNDTDDRYWRYTVTSSVSDLSEDGGSGGDRAWDTVMLCRLQPNSSGSFTAVFADCVNSPSNNRNKSDGRLGFCDESNSENRLGNVHTEGEIDRNKEVISLPLVVVGDFSPEMHVNAGRIVALFNALLVKEVFNVRTVEAGNRDTTKKYLMVNVADVVSLQTGSDEREAKKVGDNEGCISKGNKSDGIRGQLQEYIITLTSKTALVMENGLLRQGRIPNLNDLMFLCKGTIKKCTKPNRKNNSPASSEGSYFGVNADGQSGFNSNMNAVSNPKDNCLSVFIRFKGIDLIKNAFQRMYFLCELTVNVPLKDSLTLNRKTAYRWLRPLTLNQGSSPLECVDFPPSAALKSINHTLVKDEITVAEALDEHYLPGCLLTVVGRVRNRYHMTPSFVSQNLNLTEECDINDVGVPGCKNIRLVLQHHNTNRDTQKGLKPRTSIVRDDDHFREIAVYVSLKNNNLIAKYPKGLLPGTQVRLRGVTRSVSKNDTPYLQCNPFTLIEVISLPPLEPVASFLKENDPKSIETWRKEAPHIFLFEICGIAEWAPPANEMNDFEIREFLNVNFETGLQTVEESIPLTGTNTENKVPLINPASVHQLQSYYNTTTSVSRPLFVFGGLSSCDKFTSRSIVQMFATVTQINKVTLGLECPACHSDVTVLGTCSYVGCHANAPPKLTTFAKLAIEDGFSKASVIIKREELLRILLKVPSSSWITLSESIVKYKTVVTYLPKHSGETYVDPLSLVSGSIDTGTVSNQNKNIIRALTKVVHVFASNREVYRTVNLLLRPMKKEADCGTDRKPCQLKAFYGLDLREVVPVDDVDVVRRMTGVSR